MREARRYVAIVSARLTNAAILAPEITRKNVRKLPAAIIMDLMKNRIEGKAPAFLSRFMAKRRIKKTRIDDTVQE